MTHSKGPWKRDYRYGSRVIVTGEDEAIMGNETYYPWVPQNLYDWYLIAAAPDLLEALEGVISAMEGVGQGPFDAERKVIAKARGEI